jgi:hypothetical protein
MEMWDNHEIQRRQVKVLALVCVIVLGAFYVVDEDPDPEGYLLAGAVLAGLVGVGFLLVRRLRS